jgi:ubiquinone/menaquinone biosynthesis C-methylase UbiE
MNFLKTIYFKFFPGSTLAHKLFWKYRYTFGKGILDEHEIISGLDHPHRSEIITELKRFPEIGTVLEIGSSWGPNLVLINKHNPDIYCTGIDISRNMVDAGTRYFKKQGYKKIRLIRGDMTLLTSFGDNEFDLIISDAALIYVDARKIVHLASEMARVAKSGLILVEFDQDNKDPLGQLFEAAWIRDYEMLFHNYASRIDKRRISEKIWPGKWSANGKIISIFFNKLTY